MATNTLQTYGVVGNREDLIDQVFMVSPTDTPFTSAIAKTSANAVYHEWQSDSLRAPSASNAKVEGLSTSFNAQTATVRIGNYTQIVSDSFSVSNTQDAVRKAGPDEISRLKAKKAVELKKDIEASVITNGVSVIGNATTARQMKGLKGFLITNFAGGVGSTAPVAGNPGTGPVAGTNRAFSETLLKAALQAAYTAGGNVSQAHVRPSDKQVASGFTGNATRFQSVEGQGKSASLTTAYTVYASDFGNVSMIPNRVMAAVSDNAVYVVDTDMFALASLRPFKTTDIAVTGDSQEFLVTWEGTLEARNESSSAQIRDLS